MPPALIENVGRMAGMPVGPLSLNDEVALDLAWKIFKATEADLGAAYEEQKGMVEEMVEKRERFGRKNDGLLRLSADRPEAAVAGPRRHADGQNR